MTATIDPKLLRKLRVAKETRRQELAKLPIEEKIKILVELQKIAFEIDKAMGRPARSPWNHDQ